MNLALFDLDNTLLGGDSDYLWGEYLSDNGIVDGEAFRAANAQFYEDYKNGCLDIDAFLALSLSPLATNKMEDLLRWRERFLETKIQPIMLTKAVELIEKHRDAGDTLMIITATNEFVTRPIADLFGIEHLIATRPEMKDGRYTGKVDGIPNFQNGKVTLLNEWVAQHNLTFENTWFYSDSNNDTPLLKEVTYPIAVDPDEKLRQTAIDNSWPVISLR